MMKISKTFALASLAWLPSLVVGQHLDRVTVDVEENLPGNKAVLFGRAFTSDDKIFEYDSQWKQSQQIIIFELSSGETGDYTAFRLKAFKNDQTSIEVETADGTSHKMKMKPDKDLKEEDAAILDDLAVSELGQTFVATSRELGEGLGKTGADSAAALSFHRMALWMSKTTTDRRKLGQEQDQLEEEVEMYISDFDRDVARIDNGHRELAIAPSGCHTTNCCGNSCFGKCGDGCNCWWYVCETCSCVPLCQEHDYWCSCQGMHNFWCINMFWVSCSVNGYVNHCPSPSCDDAGQDCWYGPGCDSCDCGYGNCWGSWCECTV